MVEHWGLIENVRQEVVYGLVVKTHHAIPTCLALLRIQTLHVLTITCALRIDTCEADGTGRSSIMSDSVSKVLQNIYEQRKQICG